MRDASFGLAPNLRAGGGEVGVGIVEIVELIQHLALPLTLHLQRQIARPFHPLLTADRISSAPYARIAACRSVLMFSGINSFSV